MVKCSLWICRPCIYTVKPVFKEVVSEREQPVFMGHLRKVSYILYLSHVTEPVMKGHLSFRDTFFGILRCPLITGFTVVMVHY